MELEEQRKLAKSLTDYIRKSFNIPKTEIWGTIGSSGIGEYRPLLMVYIEPDKAPAQDEIKQAVNNIIKRHHKTEINNTSITEKDETTQKYKKHDYLLIIVYLLYEWND